MSVSKKYFVNLDLQSNQTVNLKADTLDITTNLASANTKRIVYWSGSYYYSDGTNWIAMGGGGGSGTVTSVGLTMPSAFTVSNSPITTSGDISVTGAGTTSQYIRGDGTLATFPTLTGYVPYTGATADLDLGTYNLIADHITLNTNSSGAGYVVGTTEWNNTDGTSQTLLKGGSVSLKNGVDLVARIVNKAVPNQTLTKAQYQVVKVSGATGGRLTVDLALADQDLNSADTLGVVIETIPTNQEGFIMTVGQLIDINTTGSLQGETWADGDVLYLSPTTAGAMTNVKPNGSTGHIVVLGYIEYAHPTQGKIYIKIMNGWELAELHDCYINNPQNNQLLTYVGSPTNLWENKSLGTILGGSTSQYVRGDGTLATFPTSITTLNSLTAQVQYFAVGTSGTDFAISSVTDTHTFNLPTASASNRGALSSTDWSTFNNKVSSTITISTTAPLSGGGDLSANRTLSISQSNTTTDGYLSSTDWNTFNNKSSKITISDEGTSLTTEVTSINFTGAGVTATNVGDAVTVNVSGGGSSVNSATANLFAYYNFI